ncbi:hypothetical protein [Biformimicrobium ophioploci]|uniref:Uncharacterized protein n=1 Tax=Biformimicrobium ophioploci TaxID=3036711 RepID=A0ABQ6M326_9GAMM|nr:hypothetical protein [Microbulbifer sp. NKW57]GMG88761.1 hypothetical protein MNKW57_30820 [Microbulbifer sp. NKW57]
MEKPTLALLSTSNGILKGGISASLGKYFQLKNFSKGACSSGLGIFSIGDDPELLNSDFILLDYTINDNEHLTKGWISPTHLEDLTNHLYSILSLAKAEVFVLLMPMYSYLDRAGEQKGVNLHIKLAKKYGFKILDGYDFIINSGSDNFSRFFMDNAHLNRFAAYLLGSSIGRTIINSQNKIKGDIETKFDTQSIGVVNPPQFLHDGKLEVKGTSLGKRECVSINDTQEVVCRIDNGHFVNGIVVNANSKAKISLDFGSRKVIKDIYSGGLSDEKIEIKYIPLYEKINSDLVKITIANFDTEVTERSPKSHKKLNKNDYGSADIFCIVTSNSTPLLKHRPSINTGSLPLFSTLEGLTLEDCQMILRDLESHFNSGISGASGFPDLLREMTVFFEKHGVYESASLAISRASLERPSGSLIEKIKLRVAGNIEKREKLFNTSS